MRLGQIGFSCWELIFAIIRKYPVPRLLIFSFILRPCNRNTYFQTHKPVFCCFCVNFCGKNVSGSFFARTYFCGSLEKPQKSQTLEPAKNSCYTVLHKVAVPLKERSLNRTTSSEANILRPSSQKQVCLKNDFSVVDFKALRTNQY